MRLHFCLPARGVRKQAPRRLGLCAAALSLVFCSFVGVVAAISGSVATAETSPQKVIQGKVLDESEVGQTGAVVYLKSAKSDAIKSYIATAGGEYRFGQLAPDTDYTLWAELNGRKSATKTITAFDNKKQFIINLRLTDKGK